MIISKGCLVLDSIVEVYNFTVENCHNYFVGRSSVLVHNDHGTGILGKMSAALRIQVTSLDALQEGLSARMLDYIEQFGGDKILTDLLDTKKFDELTERLKRTAQSAVRKFEINELNVGKYSKMKSDFTENVANLTAHHLPSDKYMKNKSLLDIDGNIDKRIIKRHNMFFNTCNTYIFIDKLKYNNFF